MRRGDAAGAQRYARALLGVARESADPALLRDELEDAARTLAGHAGLAAALAEPTLPAGRKVALVDAVWGGASPLLRRLLRLLVERDRLPALPAVAEAYGRAWDAERGVVAAEVTTAGPLAAAQRSALEAALGRLAGATVTVLTAEDPALLGGVLVRMEGRTYDGSVRGRLRALRERLLQGS